MGDFNERATFFPYRDSWLAGVLTEPAEPNGRAVLLVWGGGTYPSSGRNRIRAQLSRALAAEGFCAFRYDKPGVGESAGEYRVPRMSEPHTDEVDAAVEWLRSQGFSRLIIVGNCFGGWSSLAAAPSTAGLEAMVIISSPVGRDHGQVRAGDASLQWWIAKIKRLSLKKLLIPARRAKYRREIAAKANSIFNLSRADRTFTQRVQYLIERRIPVLLLYGDDDFRKDIEEVISQDLGPLLEEAGPLTQFIASAERLQGLGSLTAQHVLLRTVVDWLQQLVHEQPNFV